MKKTKTIKVKAWGIISKDNYVDFPIYGWETKYHPRILACGIFRDLKDAKEIKKLSDRVNKEKKIIIPVTISYSLTNTKRKKK